MMMDCYGAGNEDTMESVYAELLHQAHVEGLHGMAVRLLQAPGADNGHVALVQAEVHTAHGVFSALGEAGGNGQTRVGGVCAAAEMQAKVRALRDALDAPTGAAMAVVASPQGEAAEGALPASLQPQVAGDVSAEVARRIAALSHAQRPALNIVRGASW